MEVEDLSYAPDMEDHEMLNDGTISKPNPLSLTTTDWYDPEVAT